MRKTGLGRGNISFPARKTIIFLFWSKGVNSRVRDSPSIVFFFSNTAGGQLVREDRVPSGTMSRGPPSPRLWHLSACLWLAIWVCLAAPQLAFASKFPNRRAANACSLRSLDTNDLLDRNCQVVSVHGESASDGGGVLNMSFGEANCTVELTSCVPGVCYSIVDKTYELVQDEVPRKQPSSFFSSVSFEGAKDVSHTPRGIAFRSEGSRVVLTYSTHTCSDFYWYHGKEKRQLCNRPYAAVREIDAGAPYSLPCA